jgi:hypothetical protein
MAELDPEKLGRVGIDPTTGSPLSQEVRNALLRKSTIDAATFRNEMSASENRRKEVDIQNAEVIRSQEQALIGFNSNIQSLRTDIGKLGTGLASIALLLQQDGAEEQNRLRQEQETQRRLTERQVRVGKENEIEQKIQNALAAPVQNITPKVSDTFGKIGAALGILFGGWLTKQTVDAIKASEEGNTKLFNEIKWNIIKGLGIVGGGLLAIKAGFGLVMRTIGGIGRGLSKLLIAKPLAIAAALLPKVPKPGRTPPPGKGPGGGRGLGIFGTLFGALDAFMNFQNGENVDGVMRTLALVLPAVGPLGVVKGLMAVGANADFIAEAFKHNLFGKDPNAAKIVEAAEAEKAKSKKKPSSKPPAASTKPTPSATPPAAQPQTPMMGTPAPAAAPAPTLTKEQQDKYNQATSALQGPFAGVARGKVTDYYNKLSPEDQKTFKDYLSTRPQSEQNLYSFLKETAPSSSTNSPASTIPAQITTPPAAEPQRVGELPEAKPSLTMIKTSNGQNQQANVPLTSGPLSDVPFINSANPDNFYALYSQLNYNVVT